MVLRPSKHTKPFSDAVSNEQSNVLLTLVPWPVKNYWKNAILVIATPWKWFFTAESEISRDFFTNSKRIGLQRWSKQRLPWIPVMNLVK